MRAELVLMGKRIDMSAQKRRRMLVVLIYAAIAALITAMWFLDHWHRTGIWIFWAAFIACYVFLGGRNSYGGLVKPFHNKRTKTYNGQSFLMLRLGTYLPIPGEGSNYLNDERELHQRGNAHYKAYQVIGLAVVMIWGVALYHMDHPQWFRRIPMSPDELYYGLLLIVIVLVLTLPQSILLWTEPDMEPAPEFVEEP